MQRRKKPGENETLSRRERLRRWWQGDLHIYGGDEFIGLGWNRSPVAAFLDASLKWIGRNGWQITGTVIGIIGLILAWAALK